MKYRATIYDVAKEADVSLATVSRVLNNNPAVRQETRERVEQAVKKLGYRPNDVARGLAVSKSTSICIISNANFLQYNQKIITGMMDVAKIYNYNVFIHTISRGITEMEDIIEKIVQKRIDGVILFKGHFTDKELEMLEDNGIPTVIVGTRYDISNCEKVGNVYIDFEKMGYDLANNYLDKGIDDISFVRDHINTAVSSRIIKGISKAFEERNKKFTNVLLYEIKETSSYDTLCEILKERKPSKLMITVRDTHALSVLHTYEDMGYKCPDDFELINILDSKYLNMFKPIVSSYGVPEYDMGAIGCRLLTKLLEEKRVDDLQPELSYFMSNRDTTK